MHQYERRNKNPHDIGIRRIYGIKDSGAGGEFQFQKVQVREFYIQICEVLHAGRVWKRCDSGRIAAACSDACAFRFSGMGRMDIQSLNLPGHQLSVRAGNQYSAQLLRGDRRSKQGGDPGEGLELS